MAGAVDKLTTSSELRVKIAWTFFLLVCYRVGAHIPVPGVDTAALADFFARLQGSVFALLDMFSGGGLSNVSVFALGIMPYISASIKITQYTRYLTVLITLVQGFGIAAMLEGMTSPGSNLPVVLNPGLEFKFVTVITLTTGTVLIMWLGEQITSRGIGNGISLIIFSGIIVGIPSAIGRVYQLVSAGDMSIFFVLLLLVVMAVVLFGIVFVERAQRRIPIHYAKRQMGRKVYGGQTTHLPLRINTAGVIPPIFAQSLLLFPATIGSFSTALWLQEIVRWFQPSSIVFFFCYFYTAVIFDPKDIAENLKKAGGFVPGIRPGDKTREYIDSVLSRLTLWGGVYISAISILPMFLISKFNVPFYFGGTSILILVGVAMDFMGQVESHMISKQYDNLMEKNRIKGR